MDTTRYPKVEHMMDTNTSNNEMEDRSPLLRKRKLSDVEESTPCNDYEWENSKENVMPLKRGRTVTDLNATLRTIHTSNGKIKLIAGMKEIEETIQSYKGDDPLLEWAKYIRWIEEKMPENTRKKFAVLEKCTRVLKSHSRYQNDVRYIRLWIQYADMVSNPKDIFKYLYQNKIGEHVALFYLGWALVLESVGDYPLAHKIYLKALEKDAQPIDLVSRKYKEFQQRMSQHWLRINQENGNSDRNAEVFERFALGDITTEETSSHVISRTHEFQQQGLSESLASQNANKPVFNVYEDVVGNDVDVLDENTDWKYFGAMKQQNKENDIAASKWRQGTSSLQNATTFSSERSPYRSQVRNVHNSRSEFFDVYIDNDSLSTSKTTSLTASTPPRRHGLTLRQRLDGAVPEEELLAIKPLKNFDANKINKSQSNTAKSNPKRQLPTLPEKPAYNVDVLLIDGNVALSFEEIRAANFSNSKNSNISQTNAQSPSKSSKQITNSTANKVQELTPDTQHEMRSLAALNGSLPLTHNSRKYSQSSTFPQDLQAKCDEDVTINTRVALDDVNSMFCSPQRLRHGQYIANEIEETPFITRTLHFSRTEEYSDSDTDHSHNGPASSDEITKTGNINFSHNDSFQIYEDEADDTHSDQKTPFKDPATCTTIDNRPSGDYGTNQKRKPLGSRQDIVKHSKVTNKDMMLKVQEDMKRNTEAEEKKEASEDKEIKRYHSKFHSSHWNLSNSERPEGLCASTKDKNLKHVIEQPAKALFPGASRSNPYHLNPYDTEYRFKMISHKRVRQFVSECEKVSRFKKRLPPLPSKNRVARRFRKPISIIIVQASESQAQVLGLLGSGGFAHVFYAVVYDDQIASCRRYVALKYEKSSLNLIWEFYITHEIQRRIIHQRITPAQYFLVSEYEHLSIYPNGTLLTMEKSSQGTLYDMVSYYRKLGKSIPEPLVVYYALQMMHTLEILHSTNVLHGDVKPDNWLLVNGTCESISSNATNYLQHMKENTQKSYAKGAIRLIDFGRSIDMTLYPPNTVFTGNCHVKGFQTIEMINHKPWTYQIDTYGLCGTIHCMLFGEYMVVTQDNCSKRWRLSNSFKRYWDNKIWSALFDELLNVRSCHDQPCLATLRSILESYYIKDIGNIERLHNCLMNQEHLHFSQTSAMVN